MEKLTLLHAASKGGQKQWSIWCEPDGKTITVEWGLVGKKLQTSSDTAVPKGKVGTKAFKDEYVCARENYDKQIRKKREEGYSETGTTAPTDGTKRDYLMGLDKQFVPAKPRQDMSLPDLVAFDPSSIIIQRKRDGRRHLVLKTTDGRIRIYSRRMEELTNHLPGLRQKLEALSIPNGTILDGEIIVDRDGVDDFRAVGTFTNPKSNPVETAKREAALPVRFMVFDVLFYSGAPVWKEGYASRFQLVHSLVPGGDIFAPTNLPGSLFDWTQVAKEKKWEGLVVWFAYDSTFVRDGGKPKRCGCAKWKPTIEKDVIAVSYFLGSGELSNVVGGFNIAEYVMVGGRLEMRDCGKIGTGLNAQDRVEALTWDYPCVIAIEADRQEPEGKFRFGVFLKKHEDKTPDECIGEEIESED